MKKLIAVLLVITMMACLFAGCQKNEAASDGKSDGVTIAMLPKFKGENYFDACKVGAEAAAEALGVTLLYDGPSQDQATNQMQVDILEGWINQGVDAIVVSPNDGTASAATLKKAAEKGIKGLTFDATNVDNYNY